MSSSVEAYLRPLVRETLLRRDTRSYLLRSLAPEPAWLDAVTDEVLARLVSEFERPVRIHLWVQAKQQLEPRKPWADRYAWTPAMRREHGNFLGGLKTGDGGSRGRPQLYTERYDRELGAIARRMRERHPRLSAAQIARELGVKRWKVQELLAEKAH